MIEHFQDVRPGMALRPFAVPLTLQRLVMEAGVNRDFAPMHHDRDEARLSGAPDVYANTLLIQAIYEAALRQTFGLAARLRGLTFDMQYFNLVDEVLVAKGYVTEKRRQSDRGLVLVAVWTETSAGTTSTGTATVDLPMRTEVRIPDSQPEGIRSTA